jgi:hypothetical protein
MGKWGNREMGKWGNSTKTPKPQHPKTPSPKTIFFTFYFYENTSR